MERFQDLKKQLEAKKQKLWARVHKINRDLRQEEEPLSADWQEQAQQLENEEVLQALDQSSRQELEEINIALERMKAGTYNICVECGDEIKERRLRALPYTRLCIDCATEAESKASRSS